MSIIQISRAHTYTLDELRNNIDKIRKEIEHRYQFKAEWDTEKQLLFRRKGASGSIEIDECSFQMTLRLGMMYRTMKNNIQQEIESVINEHL